MPAINSTFLLENSHAFWPQLVLAKNALPPPNGNGSCTHFFENVVQNFITPIVNLGKSPPNAKKWLTPETFDSAKLTPKHQTHPPRAQVAQCNAYFDLGSLMGACVGTARCHFCTIWGAGDQNQRIFTMFGIMAPPNPSQNESKTKNWSIHFACRGQPTWGAPDSRRWRHMQQAFCVLLLSLWCNAIRIEHHLLTELAEWQLCHL